MQEEWAFYMVIIAILFTLIRHVPNDTNETEITHTHTHTQIPQSCWMALSWTHCTKKRPVQIPETCGIRFWNDSFQAGVFDIKDEKRSVEPFTKDFVSQASISKIVQQKYWQILWARGNTLHCRATITTFSSFCNFLPRKYFPYFK